VKKKREEVMPEPRESGAVGDTARSQWNEAVADVAARTGDAVAGVKRGARRVGDEAAELERAPLEPPVGGGIASLDGSDDGLGFERISLAVREQVRAHPARTLAMAAVAGLLLGKLLGRR
jgi:hypothetical protein